MSTAGSDRNDGAGEAARARAALIRWRAIIVIVLVAGLLAAFWILFADRIVRSTLAEAATESLGTQVDIASADIDLSSTTLELRGIAIAHPFDSTRNIAEIGRAFVALEAGPLLRKRFVIRELNIDAVRADVARENPARRVKSEGFLPRALRNVQAFRKQFDVPLLSLTPIDTIKSLVLDPTQLQTVKAAEAVANRADSVRQDVVARVQSIRPDVVVDSAQALVARLEGKSPRTLGIAGTRDAVRDVRRLIAQVDSAKRRVEEVRNAVDRELDSLRNAVRAVDDARRADYAFARGLLALPSFDAPDIGPALFGDVSIDAIQQGMYWVMLAREYAPPGLLPRENPGPKRLRRDGTTIRFATRESYPAFHLRNGVVNVSLGESVGAARGEYTLTLADLTSDPVLVGRPMRISFTRSAAASAVESIDIDAQLDHTGETPKQAIQARLAGIDLPSFDVPSLPLRLDLGAGTSTFDLTVDGDAIHGRWTVSAPSASWLEDTSRKAADAPGALESLITRVISGIGNIQLAAEVSGTLAAPKLAVQSNLDQLVADNIRRVAGEEIARAEAKVRAEVDAKTAEARERMQAKVDDVRAEADARVREVHERLERARAELDARLKALGGGLLGG